MTARKIVVLFVLMVLAATGAFAQATDAHTVTITVAAIGVLQLSSNADIPFTTVAPANPGNPPGPLAGAPATDASKSLFYTTANHVGKTRHITVGSDVNPPAGTSLTVDSTVAGGAGTGAVGVAVSTVTADLVTAIGSVATGRIAGTSGATLTYKFWVSAPASLVVGAAPTVVTVTYTMTADTF